MIFPVIIFSEGKPRNDKDIKICTLQHFMKFIVLVQNAIHEMTKNCRKVSSPTRVDRILSERTPMKTLYSDRFNFTRYEFRIILLTI